MVIYFGIILVKFILKNGLLGTVLFYVGLPTP